LEEPLKIRVCSRENGKRIQKNPENSREELLMIEQVLKGFHTQQHYACDMNASPEEQHHLI